MKKIIFSAALLLSVPLSSHAATFSDVSENYKYSEAVQYVYEQGIVSGYADGTYKPDQPINRAELLKILMEAKYPGMASGEGCFPDVQAEWFAQYVCYAQSLQVVGGYPDGTFKPAQNVSFVEAAKMITNAFQIEVQQGSDSWFQGYVEALEEKQAIPTSIGAFDKQLTRGEMAAMIYRIHGGVEWKASQTYESISQSDWSLILPEGEKPTENNVGEENSTENTPSENTVTDEPYTGQDGPVITGNMMEQSSRISILAGSDDAVENIDSGTVTVTGSELNVKDGTYMIGLRFQGVNIPKGSQVKTAYLEFKTTGIFKEDATMTVNAQATTDVMPFTTELGDLSGRTKTTESVTFDMVQWKIAGQKKFSGNIADVITAIVNHPDWEAGDSFALFLTGTGNREFFSLEGGTGVSMNLRMDVPIE